MPGCLLVCALAAALAVSLTAPLAVSRAAADRPAENDRQKLLRMIGRVQHRIVSAPNALAAWQAARSAFEAAESDLERNAVGQILAPKAAELGRHREAAEVFPHAPPQPVCTGNTVDGCSETWWTLFGMSITERWHALERGYHDV